MPGRNPHLHKSSRHRTIILVTVGIVGWRESVVAFCVCILFWRCVNNGLVLVSLYFQLDGCLEFTSNRLGKLTATRHIMKRKYATNTTLDAQYLRYLKRSVFF